MRTANLLAILDVVVAAGGGIARAEIARRTGLSQAAITGMVDELTERRIVAETGEQTVGSRGRPGKLIDVRAASSLLIIVSVSRADIRLQASDLRGDIVSSRVQAHPRGEATPERIASTVGSLVRDVWEELRGTHDALGHVVVTLPAVVDSHSGLVLASLDYGWHEPLDFAALVRTELDGVTASIGIRNNARMNAVAEVSALIDARLADDESTVVVLRGNTSIGGAVITGGGMFAGASGIAGEVGHLPIDYRGRPCACGNFGCLATFIGPEHLFGTQTTDDGEKVQRAADAFFEALSHRDPATVELVDSVCDPLAAGVLAMIAAYDPDWIVLSGYLGRLWPLIETDVMRRIAYRISSSAIKLRSLRGIRPAERSDDAVLLGATIDARREHFRAVLD